MPVGLLIIDMQMEMASRTQSGRDLANSAAKASVAALLAFVLV
jgi:hypothetical protein